jgi:hypothetical protein
VVKGVVVAFAFDVGFSQGQKAKFLGNSFPKY